MVATFPGAGSPPALRGPSGRWLEHPISTTFRWYDATRHRRPRERIRRRLWTRSCGKVAVGRGVLHHTGGDQDHRFGQSQPWLSTPRAPTRAPLHPSRTGRAQQTEVDRVVGLLNNVPDPTTQGLKTCGSKPVSGRSIALIFQWSRPGRVSPGITHAPTSRGTLRDLRTRPGPGGVGVLLLGGLQNIQDRLKSIWSVKSVTL